VFKRRFCVTVNSKYLLFVVATNVDNLAAAVLAAALAGAVRKVEFAAVGALRQLRRSQILMAAAVASAMPRDFTFRYSSHEKYRSLWTILQMI
jgi:hypothetical protein